MVMCGEYSWWVGGWYTRTRKREKMKQREGGGKKEIIGRIIKSRKE